MQVLFLFLSLSVLSFLRFRCFLPFSLQKTQSFSLLQLHFFVVIAHENDSVALKSSKQNLQLFRLFLFGSRRGCLSSPPKSLGSAHASHLWTGSVPCHDAPVRQALCHWLTTKLAVSFILLFIV